jgi:hypothetical protein
MKPITAPKEWGGPIGTPLNVAVAGLVGGDEQRVGGDECRVGGDCALLNFDVSR